MGAATVGLLVGYLLAGTGLAAALLVQRAPARLWLSLPVLAVPVTVLAALAWAILLARLPALAALLGSRGIPLAGGAWTLACALGCGLALARAGPQRLRVERGTRIVRPRWPAYRRGTVTLAGQPVPVADESKHFKLIGTTGTGKSTAIRELLAAALDRGDRAVVADPDGAYAQRFYRPERGDLVLNPFDARSARWDLFGELRQPHDDDLIARALIPDHGGEDRSWRAYARTFLSACLRQLGRAQCREPGVLHRLLTAAPVDELRLLLAGTAVAPMLADDNARFFASVRAIAMTQLAALEHLDEPAGAPLLAVRSWVRGEGPSGGPAGSLFLPYRPSQVATLGRVISTWLRLAIFEALDLEAGDHRLWFVVDELDALGPIDGLKDALVRLRKFGGRCVLGFQSVAQVSGTYGSADAQTIVENCGNTLILRCSAGENGGTARFASRLIGEREVLREQVSRAHGGPLDRSARSRTVSLHRTTESAVLPAEVEQLPDLCGYLKFASTPEWVQVRLSP
ncbi:MAG: type IV secretion system DNA-binding domain-containing protein [Proteobacteria bacterium]|nr:type IV secretion system DNA-binding domain-containing protein [Pseudomonadota bacterium]